MNISKLTNRWEIIDDNGVLYSGKLSEMEPKWKELTQNDTDVEWTGDLKFVQVFGIHR